MRFQHFRESRLLEKLKVPLPSFRIRPSQKVNTLALLTDVILALTVMTHLTY